MVVVSPNVPVIMGGSGSGGGANGADLPTHLSSISTTGGNKFVELILEYTNTDYVSGVQVNYKTGGYPTSPSDGEIVDVSGAQTSIRVDELENGETYYFRAFLYNEVDEVKYYQTDITNARITGMPIAVTITGVTPLVTGKDYIVITQSGSGTISAPAGTTIILGTGGQYQSYFNGGHGLSGGFVNSVTLQTDLINASFTANLASQRVANGTTLQINGTTYNSDSTEQIIQSKYGPIGGQGGASAYYVSSNSLSNASPGTGAGGGGNGGFSNSPALIGGTGGNRGKGGNYGGSGGTTIYVSSVRAYRGSAGEDGASGKGGAPYPNDFESGGGGGGYAAGGGAGALYNDSEGDDYYGNDGKSGTGIIVIQWDN